MATQSRTSRQVSQASLTDEQKLAIRTRVRGGRRGHIGQWETVKAEVLKDMNRESTRMQG